MIRQLIDILHVHERLDTHSKSSVVCYYQVGSQFHMYMSTVSTARQITIRLLYLFSLWLKNILAYATSSHVSKQLLPTTYRYRSATKTHTQTLSIIFSFLFMTHKYGIHFNRLLPSNFGYGYSLMHIHNTQT